ncbi:MAG: hypothetical protein H6719_31495 [Sandaracinaceae bacterium]|nr:hypothetical protein [Sandaracinaceae bacterium]
MTRALALLAIAGVAVGCETRERPAREPDHADVAPLLEHACVSCHGPDRAEGGYRVDGYVEALGCPTGAPPSAVEPPTEAAPLIAALDRDPHVGLLDEAERALLVAWVEAGAPAARGGAHGEGWVDPRSPAFHGRALRDERWARMLDPDAPGACARCHGGEPDPEADGGIPAPGATPCASCHREENGPLACTTCHGTPGHPSPPRDPCFHPDEATTAGVHAAHERAGFACATCHGERTTDQLAGGEHGDGVVQVALDPATAGSLSRWDPVTRSCTGTCHARGGERPVPTWAPDPEFTCSSCHLSPPAGHYAGTCDRCHAEAAPNGDALTPGPLHLSGRVDIGDGTGRCGACHGEGEDPTPPDASHQAHTHPTLSVPIACDQCHVVPVDVGEPTHFDSTPGAEVIFAALARARGADPSFDGESCAGVACHGDATPTWNGGPLSAACGTCHGLPPAPPHVAAETCGASRCHVGLVGPGPSLTEAGVMTHVDGRVDPWAATSSP